MRQIFYLILTDIPLTREGNNVLLYLMQEKNRENVTEKQQDADDKKNMVIDTEINYEQRAVLPKIVNILRSVACTEVRGICPF